MSLINFQWKNYRDSAGVETATRLILLFTYNVFKYPKKNFGKNEYSNDFNIYKANIAKCFNFKFFNSKSKSINNACRLKRAGITLITLENNGGADTVEKIAGVENRKTLKKRHSKQRVATVVVIRRYVFIRDIAATVTRTGNFFTNAVELFNKANIKARSRLLGGYCGHHSCRASAYYANIKKHNFTTVFFNFHNAIKL